jgi:hypothetical protein
MNPSPRTPRTGHEWFLTAWKRIGTRRRTASTYLLRGACYGAGTGFVGLIFTWVEHRL